MSVLTNPRCWPAHQRSDPAPYRSDPAPQRSDPPLSALTPLLSALTPPLSPLTLPGSSTFRQLWCDELLKMAYNLLSLHASVTTVLQKAHTRICRDVDRAGRIPVKQ